MVIRGMEEVVTTLETGDLDSKEKGWPRRGVKFGLSGRGACPSGVMEMTRRVSAPSVSSSSSGGGGGGSSSCGGLVGDGCETLMGKGGLIGGAEIDGFGNCDPECGCGDGGGDVTCCVCCGVDGKGGCEDWDLGDCGDGGGASSR